MALRPGVRRLFRLPPMRAADAVRDVNDEVELHIALRADQLMREGLERTAAEAEARRLFAQDEHTLRALYATAQDRNQHMRIVERWESLLQDIRYAARGLARDPMLALFIVLTLALGVGANVTAYSLVDRLLVRGPAEVRDPEGVLRLYSRIQNTTTGEQRSSWIPYLNYKNLRDGMSSFTQVGAYRISESTAGRGADAYKVRVGQTTGAFFPVLGVQPVMGRFFSSDEDAATSGPLAIVSERLWRTRLGADPAVLGKTITVLDEPHTIVGIAPTDFSGTDVRRVDVWVVFNSSTAGFMNWNILGRLRPGSTIASVSADAAAVHARTSDIGPKWMKEATIFAAPIAFNDSGREPLEATMARWIAGVSTIILLISFANVVNLLLVRLARRRRELAIRVALGSGRARVIRLLAMEGALLALASGVASLLVARIVEPVVRRALFADQAAWTFSLLDARVLATLLAIVLLTALIVGIVPALQAGNPQLTAALRTTSQGGGGGTSRTRSALTVLQAALSVLLLVGAGLFLRSLAKVGALEMGIDRGRVITAAAEMPRIGVPSRSAMLDAIANERDINRRLVDAVRQLPGVERASIAVGLPLDGGSFSAGVFVQGIDSVPSLPFQGPYVSVVTTDYFATVGTAILRGRAFGDQDREGSELVIIVNETMARALWPGRDAIDQCVRVSRADAPCARVVGVAANVNRIGLHEQQSLQYYLPLGQTSMFGGAALVVRPTAAAPVTARALLQTMLRVEPNIRSVDIKPLEATLEGEMRPLRLGMMTFGLSGGLALFVAVLGLYSLMSYMVAWRTREIGVRLALGATDARITRLVVGSGTGLAALGIVIGLALALLGGRFVQPHLFNTSAFDPVVLGGVTLTLLAVALLAGWLPARRAVRISPTEALRSE